MKFTIAEDVFSVLPDAVFGVVAATEIDNTQVREEIRAFLKSSIADCERKFQSVKVKEAPELQCYREAFRTLGINPNKYMCSIEALLTRVAKGKGFPFINALVDLGNAISLKYCLPIGAHDLQTIGAELSVRFSEEGDEFIPFGMNEAETPEEKELLYVSGHEVRTRRWTWRQSECGKITEQTTSIFYPIDGFCGCNQEEVLAARDELADCIKKYFQGKVITGVVDRNHPEFSIAFL